MEPLVYFIGRLHPMLVHAPIGMLIGLIVLEVVFKVRRSALQSQLDHTVRIALLFLIASSCVAAIVTGLIRRDEEGYGSLNADLHQWFGIGLGVVLIGSCIAAACRALKTYATMLILAAGLITAAGHFGASLTHGTNFLTEPFISRVPKPLITQPNTNGTEQINGSASNAATTNATTAAANSSTDTNTTPPAKRSQFQLTVAPILENRCVSCHGPTKIKGSLRLDSPESILAGGDVGPALLAADPLQSPILTRLLLPLDHDDHMPPDSRPQPTTAEIETIRAWLASGASFTAPSPSTIPLSPPIRTPAPNNTASTTANTPNPRPARPEPASHPDPAAIAALRAALIHIAPISQHSTLYEVDVAAIAPAVDDAVIEKLLTPVFPNIAHLNLARTKIGQPTLALTARMPHLAKLDLSGTPIDDAALVALASHPTLEFLTITRTAISDPAPLLTLPALTHLYCWNTRLSEEALTTLRARPGLTLNSGSRPAPNALETEPPPVLAKSSDTPPPSSTPIPTPSANLKPINSMCPVSNKPIDPTKLVVYQGRVVGLCCEHCAEAFLADPAKYAEKLPKP
jgi:uncharacterized membrane protein